SYLLIIVGIVISIVGIDQMSGALRLTFDTTWLIDGFNFTPIIMGLYGLSEVISAMEQKSHKPIKADLSLRKLMPNREEFKRSTGPMFRGGFLGFLVGLIPGPANILSTYASYGMEK